MDQIEDEKLDDSTDSSSEEEEEHIEEKKIEKEVKTPADKENQSKTFLINLVWKATEFYVNSLPGKFAYDKEDESKTVFCGNLPNHSNINETRVKDIFQPYGPVKSIRLRSENGK